MPLLFWNALWGKTRGQNRADIGTILSEVWSLICPKIKQLVIGHKALLLTFSDYNVRIV